MLSMPNQSPPRQVESDGDMVKQSDDPAYQAIGLLVAAYCCRLGLKDRTISRQQCPHERGIEAFMLHVGVGSWTVKPLMKP
jgi:hypothetical protein